MPIKWLTDYWSQAGPYVLPFLQNRKVGVQEKFDGQIIFRRHNQRKKWLYIKNQADIDQLAFAHTYSFHPHQLSDENILWFILDLDKRNDQMPFSHIIFSAKLLAQILKEDKQPFHLKYSGHRGFHFMWSLGKIKQSDINSGKIFEFEHGLIEKYASILEKQIKDHKEYKKIAKFCVGDAPVFSTNSAEKKIISPILIDKNILKPNALFRSPWSIHPATNLVAAPLEVNDLDDFNPRNYNVDKVITTLRSTSIPQ